MTKLNKKLAISISLVVVIVSIISLTINNIFIHKYYLHEKKKIINTVGDEIEKLSSGTIIKDIDNIDNLYSFRYGKWNKRR